MKKVIKAIITILTILGGIVIFSKLVFNKISKVNSKYHFILGREPKNSVVENNEENDIVKYEVMDISILSRDELKLHGKIVYAMENSRLYVLCISGYMQEARNEINRIAQYYLSKGVNVIITDQRAFGKSSGEYITFGNLESRDHMEWLNNLKELLPADARIILHGVSMGAATTLMMCRNELPKNVKGVVVQGAYSHLNRQLIYTFEKRKMPAKIIYFLYKMACFNKSIYDPERTNPIDGAENINIPVVFVHGSEDEYIPCDMSKEMFEICPSINKKLIIVEGAAGQCFKMSKEYRDTIKHLINKLK